MSGRGAWPLNEAEKRALAEGSCRYCCDDPTGWDHIGRMCCDQCREYVDEFDFEESVEGAGVAVDGARSAQATRPILLDLFCGAGGAAAGYARAGFDVVGVDIKPQPHYPFEFFDEDALLVLRWALDRNNGWNTRQFDAIHASPPCQRWTRAQRHRKNESAHPDLVTPLRPLLEATGLPYVIENVEYCDALRDPVLLCGSMFDLDVQNHRLFETNWGLTPPDWPCRHGIWAKGRFPGTPLGNGKPKGQTAMVVNRMASGVSHELLASAMGIDWIPAPGFRPSKALSEAIPPAFTEFIGSQLRHHTTAGNRLSPGSVSPDSPGVGS